MNNPINWGNSPMANAAVRGFIAAILTGLLYALYAVRDGQPLQDAAVTGLIPAVIALLALLGFGAADQARAASGTVIASDVPVQIEAKLKETSPVRDAMGDYAPQMSAKDIAQEMTAKYQRMPLYDR